MSNKADSNESIVLVLRKIKTSLEEDVRPRVATTACSQPTLLPVLGIIDNSCGEIDTLISLLTAQGNSRSTECDEFLRRLDLAEQDFLRGDIYGSFRRLEMPLAGDDPSPKGE